MKKLSYEQSMRLKQNYYALNKSYDNLSKAMNNTENYQEIYIGINEMLLWIITTNDWFEKNGKIDYKSRRNKNKKGQQILGLRYVFNRFKHNMNSINMHSTGFFAETIKSKEIKWLPVIEKKKKFENQFNNYKQYTQDKKVMKSFTNGVEFLREEYQKMMFK